MSVPVVTGATAARGGAAPLDHVPRQRGRIGLVSVSRRGGDGISYVSRLVERALGDRFGITPLTIDLDPRADNVVSVVERARLVARLAAVQVAGRVDGLLFSHIGLARAQRWVPAGARRPYAVFVHGLELTPEHISADRIRALRGATIRIANSDFTARRVASAFPDAGRVVACPLALLPEEAPSEPADERLLARIDRRRAVLILGRMSSLERYKGHDQLIEAWPRVLAGAPRAQLVVAGAGDDATRLERKAQSLGLGDRVLFAGRVSDATAARLYATVRGFAMPSRGEGFGLVYLEAMRAGLPCIASPDDGGADVVVGGETGWLVPQSDQSELVGALTSMVCDVERSRRLGEAGRARFEREYTYEAFRRRFARVIDEAFPEQAGVAACAG